MLKIHIDFNGDEPIYVQLCNQIIQAIADGQLHEGDPLPSVRLLADALGINMHTVNKSYSILKQEGFIKLDRRTGAVVSLDINKIKALSELSDSLNVILLRALCRNISRDEVHKLVDDFYNHYTII